MKKPLLRTALVLAALLRPGATAFADDAPDWFRRAASVPHPSYPATVPAVVLLDEGALRIREDGRLLLSLRQAIKVLTNEGKNSAVVRAPYATDRSKVNGLRAWLLRPSGELRRYDAKDILDLAVIDDDVYNEARYKQISAADHGQPGAVFGYEYEIEERPEFYQSQWFFQGRLPVVRSTLQATLPSAWRIEGRVLNRATLTPSVSGGTHAWELRDLPYVQPESSSPSLLNLVPRLALDFYAPSAANLEGRSYSSWAEVARWMQALSGPQAAVSPSIAAKARDLAQQATTEWDRIGAVARYVQSLKYISIQIGAGRFKPHAASDVLAKAYGDCKDKANAMLALLKSLGMTAHLVLVHAGDSSFVQESWPSPTQFNHCILAVRVGPATEAGSVVVHPTLGRLLLFDPTDPDTSLGDLPDHEQGGLGLLVAAEGGDLIRFPVTAPAANGLERRVTASLAEDGSLRASLHERALGQAAARQRAWLRGLSGPELKKSVEHWIALSATGASAAGIVPKDGLDEGHFELAVDFEVPRYGQVMQAGLLVFKPAIVSRRDAVSLTESSRQHPVSLRSRAYRESAEIALPAGWRVDETPDPVRLEAPFGRYRTSYEEKPGRLLFTRELDVRASILPVSDYPAVRRFYQGILAAEQAPVVLVRKQPSP